MALPIMTTDTDVYAIVDYLSLRPEGIGLTQAVTEVPRNLLEDRKLNAFLTWGIIKKEGNQIKLDDLGWELSKATYDVKYIIYQEIIRRVPPYQGVIRWMFDKDFSEVTNIEVASFWQMKYREYLGTNDENLMKSMATCFLNLCQYAVLGTLNEGPASKTTMFNINKTYVGRFITEYIPSAEKIAGTGVEQDLSSLGDLEIDTAKPLAAPSGPRVYISPSKNKGITEQIKTMLEIEKIAYAAGDPRTSPNLPLEENTISTMGRCTMGVVSISSEDLIRSPEGSYIFDPSTLLELGAAYLQFNKNVVLLWDEHVSVPEELSGMDKIEFSGRDLSLSAGTELLNAVKKHLNLI
jgi:hypothetical protein